MTNKNSNYKASKSDWIDIGIKALAKNGHQSLNIAVLGKEIGATKGSFYWYFSSKREFELTLFTEFEILFSSYFTQLPELLDSGDKSASRFFYDIYTSIPSHLVRLELAIRDWARNDDEIFKYCKKLDKKRLSWIESVLIKFGIVDEKQKAVKIFAFTIGMSLLPEFIGTKYKSYYKSAIEDLV